MRLRLSLLLVLALAATLTTLAPAEPSEAAAPRPAQVTPVAPGVTRAEYELTKASGAPVAAQVMTVVPTDGVRITAALGSGTVPGLETVEAMNRRLQPDGGVAVLNGGFWLNQPVGDPNSYFSAGGRLVSESETQGSLTRGTFATTPAGPVIDRVDVQLGFDVETAPGHVPVDGVNRLDRTQPEIYADGPDAIYVYTPEYGATVTIPPGRGTATLLTLPAVIIPASGTSTPTTVPTAGRAEEGERADIPARGALVVGYGAGGRRLSGLRPGERMQPRVEARVSERGGRDDLWSSVVEGVAAGPLIVRDGAMTDRTSWEQEGFSDSGHSAPSAPRSAVGVLADGTTLLVAVDGRQPSHSVGMSMEELARFLIDLGAVDGMALDGGGSTQLSVDGLTRNRPCQSQTSCGALRPVASGLVVTHDYDAAATTRLAGNGREHTAAEIARATYPQGAAEAVLAPGGDFPDALAGGPLASALGAPLLLSGRDAIDPATRRALQALGTRRITILGGPAVISAELAADLRSEGYEVRRVAGEARVETAAAIANQLGTGHPMVFVAAAGGFADALSAAAPAGISRAPILLTDRDRLPEATHDVIAASRPQEVVVVGGTGVVSPAVESELRAIDPGISVRRLAGDDRYGTARAVNDWAEATIEDLNLSDLVVARGDTFPDALAGGPFAAAQRRLLMIVPAWDVRAAAASAAYLDARAAGPLEETTLLGGLGVLSSYQEWQLDQLAR